MRKFKWPLPKLVAKKKKTWTFLDLGVSFMDEKSWVTIAQVCCTKKENLDLIGLVCLSRTRKTRQPLSELAPTKKKPKPFWTWMFIMWMKKIGQPSPKLALIERKTWAFLDLGVYIMNKKSRMTITWACLQQRKKNLGLLGLKFLFHG
jgi:hypothetical protein